jgi:hypothetical protein
MAAGRAVGIGTDDSEAAGTSAVARDHRNATKCRLDQFAAVVVS